jgi:hypothetical protein
MMEVWQLADFIGDIPSDRQDEMGVIVHNAHTDLYFEVDQWRIDEDHNELIIEISETVE